MKEADIYFFDTSALVKRYHQEAGTDVVDTAFDSEDTTKLISDLGVIEFYSAFAKKVRTGEITKEDFRAAIKALATDIQRETIHLVFFGDNEKKEAAALVEEYGVSKNLRTLDAIQLAVMKRLGAEVITEVYCADRRFIAAMEAERFSVVDPENPARVEDKKGNT